MFGADFKHLEMQVRARTPQKFKILYRIARSFGRYKPAKPLPQHLLDGARLCTSRYTMLNFLPKNAVVAELGTYRGDFARVIMARTQPLELHLIDIDYSHFDRSGLDGPQVKRHTGQTSDCIAGFAPNTFDWIYVDADHGYEATLRDARASRQALKPGGLLAFNDFAHIDPNLGRYGVMNAVTDFVLETQWPVAFLAFEPSGLYDIVLQKPD